MISKTFIKADEIRTYYQPKICFPNQVIMLSIYIERGKKKKKKTHMDWNKNWRMHFNFRCEVI